MDYNLLAQGLVLAFALVVSTGLLSARAPRRNLVNYCEHDFHGYLHFPPYCEPGGIREQLFPASGGRLSFIGGRVLVSCAFRCLFVLVGGNRAYILHSPCAEDHHHHHHQRMFNAVSSLSRHNRSGSFSDDDSNPSYQGPLPPPVLVYHESARSIVFRDHIRREHFKSSESSGIVSNMSTVSETHSVEITNYEPVIQPLPSLELGAQDEFQPLIDSDPAMNESKLNDAEKEVVNLLAQERAVVKTLKNADWKDFLHRLSNPLELRSRRGKTHDDVPAHDDYRFNSFVTSTTLLPAFGRKMRAYGSMNEYTTGVVFALPLDHGSETEDEVVKRCEVWAWPSGYAAKSEFNIDSYGNLINGRDEALVSLDKLREQNDDYLHKTDYYLSGRLVVGGLNQVPYNEVILRVGGLGRIVNSVDVATGKDCKEEDGTGRSLEKGVGLPVALFVRTATFGHLVSLLRTKARLATIVGQDDIRNIPLLLITPEAGVRVLTEDLQKQLLQIVARNLNPFQNPSIAYKTTIEDTSEACLKQKSEELLDLNAEDVEQTLTVEERARLAGGFGCTDESVAALLMAAKDQDNQVQKGLKSDDNDHHLQDIVNEGLAAAVRSGDYHTSRQLLILYSLVASATNEPEDEEKKEDKAKAATFVGEDSVVATQESSELTQQTIPTMPPPPPLDTDRLRSATNSDGLLAVLGAAQVLKAMKDGSAARRVQESVDAIDEWIEHGEQSMAFRLASWRDQRAAQGDLKIATRQDSNFMAFVSNKAISNRKNFAAKLRESISATDFEGVRFLLAIHELVSRMHSPCLRLELLQYVLGLDNRYSVAHIQRSVKLAATCLSTRVEREGP